jgi:hypothetical protein
MRQFHLIVAAALAIVAGSASADIVYLVNGGMLEGRVTMEDGRIVIEQPTGKVYLNSSKVDHIEKSRTDMDVYDERFAGLKKNDATTGEDYAQLGIFATEHGMKARAETAYKKAIAVDPDNATARVALGYVKFQDHWMTADDANIARGLVKHNGAWVTPEAKADLMKAESDADAQRSRADAEAAKAEQERLRLERVEKELRLIDAQRDQVPDYWRYNAPVVVIPSGPGTPGKPAAPSPAPQAAPRNTAPPPQTSGGVINPVEITTPEGTTRLDPSGALIFTPRK